MVHDSSAIPPWAKPPIWLPAEFFEVLHMSIGDDNLFSDPPPAKHSIAARKASGQGGVEARVERHQQETREEPCH
jgi:hypothetical protein